MLRKSNQLANPRSDFSALLKLAEETPPTRVGGNEGWLSDNGYLHVSTKMYVMCIYLVELDHYLLISRVKEQAMIVEILEGPGPDKVRKLTGPLAKKYLSDLGLDWKSLDRLLP